MWKEAVVAYSNVLSQHLLGETEKSVRMAFTVVVIVSKLKFSLLFVVFSDFSLSLHICRFPFTVNEY
jgi:hypothetical protein